MEFQGPSFPIMIPLPPAEMTLFVRVKRLHPAAKLPTRGTPGSAGLDLITPWPIMFGFGSPVSIATGIAVEIPPGWFGLIRDRSGMAVRGYVVTGGVIDSDYRGEIRVVMTATTDSASFPAGYPIAQLLILPVPSIELVEVDELRRR